MHRSGFPTGVVLLAIVFAASCIEDPLRIDDQTSVAIAFSTNADASARAAAVNTIAVRVERYPDGGPVGEPQEFAGLDSLAESWTLPFHIDDAALEEELQVVVVAELMHVDGATRTVEWSGQSEPFYIVRGERNPVTLPVYRGGLGNLTITSLEVSGPDTVAAAASIVARVTSAGATGLPSYYWTSLDPTIGVVDTAAGDSAVIVALSAGTIRVVAEAGPRADTLVLTSVGVETLVDTITVTPVVASVAIGGTTALSASALDGSGATLPGAQIQWTSLTPGTVAVNASGVVSGLVGGYGEVLATSGSASTVVSVQVGGVLRIPNLFIGLGVGSSQAISASFVNPFLTLNDLELTSPDPGIVSVTPGSPPTITGQSIGFTRLEGRIGSFVDTLTVLVNDASTPVSFDFSGNTNGYHYRRTAGTPFARLLHLNAPSGIELGSATGTIRFDPTVIRFDSATSAAPGAVLSAVETGPGVIDFTYTNTAAASALGQFLYTVQPGATVGSSTWFTIEYSDVRDLSGAPVALPVAAGGKITVLAGAANLPTAVTAPDTTFVPYGEMRSIGTVMDASGFQSFDLRPAVTVGDPTIAEALPLGSVIGRFPGQTTATASYNALSDASRIVVTTDACAAEDTAAVNDFVMSTSAGVMYYSGASAYKGVQTIFAGGVVYGTSAADLVVGYFPATGDSELRPSGVCAIDGGVADYHGLAAVRPDTGEAGPPGIEIAEEMFAFSAAPDADFVLVRYTITNYGASAVNGLSFGALIDFDLTFDAASNIARWDDAMQAAVVVHQDSVANPTRVALVAIGAPLSGWTWGMNGFGHAMTTEAEIFGFMTGGLDPVRESQVGDVRQLVAMGPLDFAPGETHVVYLAYVGGDDQAALAANVAAARARASTLP